jgi:hypothetical protein
VLGFSIKINISEKSLENIFKKLFGTEQYDKNVRPFGKDGITHVETELKLLQIDLDEKYQQLISTVWIEMVIILYLIFK